MSTASRPTYAPAVGRPSTTNIRTVYASAKDQASHTTLKLRQVGQATSEEVKKRDFRAELELKTHKYTLEKDKTTAWMAKEVEKTAPVLMLKDVEIHTEDIQQIQREFDDADVVLNPTNGGDNDSFGSDSDSDSEDDDDEDDEEELKAELERIRKERAEAAARREEEERERLEKEKKDEAIRNDPLIHLAGESAKMKRRWNDDVIFRHQAVDDPSQHKDKKRFVNDTLRSDFHRQFLKKYVK